MKSELRQQLSSGVARTPLIPALLEAGGSLEQELR